jgi:hypothetical protein
MTQDPLAPLKGAISRERFAPYAATARHDVEAIGRYVWNTRLAESLYPALLHFEVSLRNALHTAIDARFPDGPWETVPCWMDRQRRILEPEEYRPVAGAVDRLHRVGKPVSVANVVPELSFGFWNSLIDVRYERNHILWPHLLKSVAPGMLRKERTRKRLSARVNRIRNLRNRVFHHEPIWHWRDLAQQHDELLEAISWLCNDVWLLTRASDRFAEVCREGWKPHRTGVLG